MTRAEYTALLMAHDWHYEYSDDYTVWRKGEAESKVLLMHADVNPEFDEMYDAHVEGMKRAAIEAMDEGQA